MYSQCFRGLISTHVAARWFDIVSALRSLKSKGKTPWPSEIWTFQGKLRRKDSWDCEQIRFSCHVKSREQAGNKQLEQRRKYSERVLIVVSLIQALFTPTDSLSGEAFLIYTDLSENILHAFIQRSCCWSGFKPLVLLPYSALKGAQGGTSSSTARQDGQAAGDVSPRRDTLGRAAGVDLYPCTPPEAGPSFSWKVMTFHAGIFSFGVFWATTSTWFLLWSAGCPSHD